MDQTLQEILACPLCKGSLVYAPDKAELICRVDQLAYPIRDQIPVMLVDQARKIEAEEAGT